MNKLSLDKVLRGSKRSLRMHRNKRILERTLDTKIFATSDNLAFFPELNLVFNRIKKSGNTSLIIFFHEIAGCGNLEPSAVNKEKSARNIRGINLSEWENLSEIKSFVCVRNPYFRAVSGFLEKVAKGDKQEFCKYGGFGDPTVSGFEQFLNGLTSSRWASIDRHFWPQSKLFFMPPQKFSCIARLETLTDDLKPFLRSLSIDKKKALALAKPHKTEQQMPGKITNSAKRSDLISQESRRIIEDLYAQDIETFKYSL